MNTRASKTTSILIASIALALCACGDDASDGDGGASGAAAGTSGGSAGSGTSGSSGEGGSSGNAGMSGGAGGTGDTGGMGGEGGTAGAGDGGGMGGEGGMGGNGGNTDDTPISERESDDAFTCSVGQDLINYAPTSWAYSGGNILATDTGDTWLVRVEAEAIDPFTPGPYAFLASKVDTSGDIADGTSIDVADVNLVSSPRGIALADGALAALWIDSGKLWFVALDADGSITVEPKMVASDSSLMDVSNLQVARTSAGKIAALWNDSTNTPFVAVTDDTGATATPKEFPQQSGYPPRIAASGEGFALLWKSFDPDFMDPSNVFFAKLDATGAVDGEPVQITDFEAFTFGGTFGGSDLALLPVGDGYLAAWGESDEGDFETGTGAFSVLRVQALSSEGEPQGESALIASMEPDIDHAEPAFVPWDDDTVALLWARGSHIYICAGCIPNHSVKMMLIDAATFTPRSNIVEISPEMGGLLGRSQAVSGADLLMAIAIQFHVHSEPGFAAVHCE